MFLFIKEPLDEQQHLCILQCLMKMQLSTNPLIVSEEMPSSVMGMDSSGMDQACYFLRDKIYSNKILAVVREYTTNALDEHVKYNIEKPVTVRLRDNTFSVRDYAKGLSESDVRNVFGMYFKSTKRDNNSQSGCFGLGSKAAHCYTDTFYVRSFHDGVCTLYTCVLGGGSNGVPVGQIMKISEEPTSETGLEISVEVESNYRHEFFANAYAMVETCSKPIEFYNNEEYFVPLVPIKTVEKNGFVFKLFRFDSTRIARYTNMFIKMGEVNYKSDYINSYIQNSSLLEKTIMVVEIPVGKMSLPISRESFEETPSNRKMIEIIKNSINEIYSEDVQHYSNLSIQNLLDYVGETHFCGEFFHLRKSEVYPRLFPLLCAIGKTSLVTKPEEKDGKKIVALVPNKESKAYWEDKLSDHASANNKCYLHLVDSYLERINDEERAKLETIYLFKKVKSTIFNWPKTKKDTAFDTFKAKIYYKRGWYSRDYTGTALEIHNHIRKENNLSQAKDLNEAKEQMKKTDWENQNVEFLNRFTVQQGTVMTECVRTSSKTMEKFLLEIGWFNYRSPEHLNVIAKINSKAEEIAKRLEMEKAVTLAFLCHSEKESLLKKLKKKKKYLEKANNIVKCLRDEKSLRGTIFETLCREGNSYWFNRQISRKDLRKILTLK